MGTIKIAIEAVLVFCFFLFSWTSILQLAEACLNKKDAKVYSVWLVAVSAALFWFIYSF